MKKEKDNKTLFQIVETGGSIIGVVESEGIIMNLDFTMTYELEIEGLMREFIHYVQRMRKEAHFEISDCIIIYYLGSKKLEEAIIKYKDYIMKELLATNLINEYALELPPIRKTCELNGEYLTVSISLSNTIKE